MVYPFIFFLVCACVFDILQRRIPNWLVIVGGVLAFGEAILNGGMHGFVVALGGAVICGAVGFLFWKQGMIGGGDHKLMMVCGAWIGLHATPFFLIATALFGGIQACIWMLSAFLRTNSHSTIMNGLRKTSMPYSLSIAVGALVAMMLR